MKLRKAIRRNALFDYAGFTAEEYNTVNKALGMMRQKYPRYSDVSLLVVMLVRLHRIVKNTRNY